MGGVQGLCDGTKSVQPGDGGNSGGCAEDLRTAGEAGSGTDALPRHPVPPPGRLQQGGLPENPHEVTM